MTRLSANRGGRLSKSPLADKYATGDFKATSREV